MSFSRQILRAFTTLRVAAPVARPAVVVRIPAIATRAFSITRAVREEQQAASEAQTSQQGSARSGAFRKHYEAREPYEQEPMSEEAKLQAQREGRRLFIGNLSYRAGPKVLKDLLGDSVEYIDFAEKKRSRYTFVVVKTHEDAVRIEKEFQGHDLLGWNMKIEIAANVPRTKEERDAIRAARQAEREAERAAAEESA
ncbi:hypothetical protein BZA77DRAFT_300140 [Pyronema omphalodes]|nr:hypothetical protein BZA77DRAFT_300140 [Pyronema omphalodes]